MNSKHSKKKRILALIGVILLASLYLSTLVFALIGTPLANDLFKASVVCTIMVPILLYAFTLVYRLLDKKDEE